MNLPEGVKLSTLKMNIDDRGTFTELLRESWIEHPKFIQWNAVNSEQGILRGVHVHLKHYDYLTVMRGRILFALKDLRPDSPTENLSAMVEISAEKHQSLFIPPGVAHGFYMLEPSLHIYAVSEYWDMEDELGCHFADKSLEFNWPNANPRISERDLKLPALSDIRPLIPSFTKTR